ncbi:MAG: PH domain-containing protein [Anaerolineales bacterium]
MNESEEVKTLRPSPNYQKKLRWACTLIALTILFCGVGFGWLISLAPEIGGEALRVAFLITGGLNLLWWLPAMFLVGPYYRSLRYEIREDEVIVHVGIWTQSTKHVPYRTVTNLTIKRDILDRQFNLGTLEIQTAGLSGSTAQAEQSLVGLVDAQAVYERVVERLRRFRGSMAPTASEETAGALAPSPSAAVWEEMLAELRAIRRAVEGDAKE